MEFGGSGEDSFVAVVVTKLTGALLFILLLTMVIMALIPKATDTPKPSDPGSEKEKTKELAISTPEALPEAIAGRPYTLALASEGGSGPKTWSVVGDLPAGLELDAGSGMIRGTPSAGASGPAELTLVVRDESGRAARGPDSWSSGPIRPWPRSGPRGRGSPPCPSGRGWNRGSASCCS